MNQKDNQDALRAQLCAAMDSIENLSFASILLLREGDKILLQGILRCLQGIIDNVDAERLADHEQPFDEWKDKAERFLSESFPDQDTIDNVDDTEKTPRVQDSVTAENNYVECDNKVFEKKI